jgi:hypothetical protein
MANLNRVLLIGNCTRDPDLRYTPKGTPVAEIGLAVNRVYSAEDVGAARQKSRHNISEKALLSSSKAASNWTLGTINKLVRNALDCVWSRKTCNCWGAVRTAEPPRVALLVLLPWVRLGLLVRSLVLLGQCRSGHHQPGPWSNLT